MLPFYSQAASAPSVLLYIKQTPTEAAIYMDWAAAFIQDRYVGKLIYQPGKTYRLTHRLNPTISPKLFTVLGYAPPETLNPIDPIELDLILRYFNPYTEDPRPAISRVRFPLCLDESLSSNLWDIKTVAPPSQAKTLSDEIIPLLTRDAPLRPTSETRPERSLRTPGAITSVVSQPDRLNRVPPTPANQHPNNSSNDAHSVEVTAPDKERVREILKRWVKLSEVTQIPWQSLPSNQGIVIRDKYDKLLFDFCTTEANLIRTPQSALVLQGCLMEVARIAFSQLSSKTEAKPPSHKAAAKQLSPEEEKLLLYAQDVIDRLQSAPTDSVPNFLRSLLNLRRKITKPHRPR